MLIDVILPTFNRVTVLERAIESVLKQKHQDFNLYVINDGSQDSTQELMERYQGHPKVHYLWQNNQGVSAARNLGIKSSSAPWLAFLDSDDEWLPHKLTKQIEFMRNEPNCRLIHSNEMWIRKGVRVNPPKKFDKSNDDIFHRSLEMCLISPSTVMIKRELCEEHGNFDEEFVVCEDYDLWLKILANEKVGFISDHLIKKYGGHEDQLSMRYPAMDYWRLRSLIRLYSREGLALDKKDLILQQINKKAPILLQGYLKHQNQTAHQELTYLLKGLPGW